jgi:small subunit ribosomal protein S1
VVLSIDVERERISLGIKQIEGDPFSSYIQAHEKNSTVTGTVKAIDPKGAVIQLDPDVEGYLRASEVSRDRVEDIRTKLNEGDKVTAMIINIDRKNRTINLSVKARDTAEDAEAMKKLAGDKQAATGTTNLGALLKAKLDVANTQQ